MACATVIKGSGNVFRDLGFSEEKSAGLMLKSCLLQSVQGTIKRKGWKQIEAAGHLGIDQAKVSKLLCRADGRIFHRTPRALSVLAWARCGSDRSPGSSWKKAWDCAGADSKKAGEKGRSATYLSAKAKYPTRSTSLLLPTVAGVTSSVPSRQAVVSAGVRKLMRTRLAPPVKK